MFREKPKSGHTYIYICIYMGDISYPIYIYLYYHPTCFSGHLLNRDVS